jgi:[NiFe] hydrogenase assembly HybE family chaperone
MTDPDPPAESTAARAPAAERRSPAAALEQRFRVIWRQQMQDVPIVNGALTVEAVGFRPWREHWLGILITPWFMNLWLMPRVDAAWSSIGERESRHHVFPAGVFEFIGGRDPVLGDYQACSLFSPMFDFADAIAARSTALASLDALFDAATREAGDIGAGPRLTAEAAVVEPALASAPPATALSKRSFLFGQPPQADRGP